MIFAVGGGSRCTRVSRSCATRISSRILHGTIWNCVVLGLAVIFEGYSWSVAFRAFRMGQRGRKKIWRAIHTSKDPTLFAVLFEDSAALLGLLAPLMGISLSYALPNPTLDGLSSLVIGIILATVAVLLAYESKGLLVGESADTQVVASIRALGGRSGRGAGESTAHHVPRPV
jgi:divalent metal cation (Fe/Co/Zn/Cd) transporter